MAIDYHDYPSNFRALSRHVRFVRAQGRCEHCGVRHGAVGHWERTAKNQPPRWVPLCGNAEADELGAGYRPYAEGRAYAREYNRLLPERTRLRVVKLACAHLDQDITHNQESNLAALCQGCHRFHDSKDNAERRKYGETGQHRDQPRLFDDSRYAPKPDVPRVRKEPRKKRKYERKR